MQPPNDVRNFVHKRLGRAIVGGLKGITGGPGGIITGAARGFVGAPRVQTRRSGGQPIVEVTGPPQIRIKGQRGTGFGRCPDPNKVRLPTGRCVRSDRVPAEFARGAQGAPIGDAEMGRFGAGLQPMTETRTVRECLPGMVLGKDGLCYNKGDIANQNREWPRGRRPLGTPGEMAALAKAATFGRRMETTVKRMQKIGVLKRPARRSAPRQAQKLIGPGHSHTVTSE